MEASGIEPQEKPPGEPTVLIEITTVDTGERKKIFGHAATHVITARKETPLEGSQSQPKESTADGWYIDLDNRISCDRRGPEGNSGYTYSYTRLRDANAAREMPKFVAVGKPETGFAVEQKTTAHIRTRCPMERKKRIFDVRDNRCKS